MVRAVSGLMRQLPAVDSDRFREEFDVEYNDTMLMVYLATLTEGASRLNDYVEHVGLACALGFRAQGP